MVRNAKGGDILSRFKQLEAWQDVKTPLIFIYFIDFAVEFYTTLPILNFSLQRGAGSFGYQLGATAYILWRVGIAALTPSVCCFVLPLIARFFLKKPMVTLSWKALISSFAFWLAGATILSTWLAIKGRVVLAAPVLQLYGVYRILIAGAPRQ